MELVRQRLQCPRPSVSNLISGISDNWSIDKKHVKEGCRFIIFRSQRQDLSISVTSSQYRDPGKYFSENVFPLVIAYPNILEYIGIGFFHT